MEDHKSTRKLFQSRSHVKPYFRFTLQIFLIHFVLTMIATKLWPLLEGNVIHYITHECRSQRIRADNLHDIAADIVLYMQLCCKKTSYLGKYMFCNIFTFVLLTGQTIFFLLTLQGFETDASYLSGIYQVLKWHMEPSIYREDPLIKIFPRLLGCDYSTFGYTGTIQQHSFLCVSAFNATNEKLHIYAALVLFILLIAFLANFLYTWVVLGFISNITSNKNQHVKTLITMPLDQRFILLLVSKNVDKVIWEAVLDKIAETEIKFNKKQQTFIDIA
jgi:hypothetical protein